MKYEKNKGLIMKSLFLVHSRSSHKEDFSGFGFDVSKVDEEMLEVFCPCLPTSLFPILDRDFLSAKPVGGGA